MNWMRVYLTVWIVLFGTLPAVVVTHFIGLTSIPCRFEDEPFCTNSVWRLWVLVATIVISTFLALWALHRQKR